MSFCRRCDGWSVYWGYPREHWCSARIGVTNLCNILPPLCDSGQATCSAFRSGSFWRWYIPLHMGERRYFACSTMINNQRNILLAQSVPHVLTGVFYSGCSSLRCYNRSSVQALFSISQTIVNVILCESCVFRTWKLVTQITAFDVLIIRTTWTPAKIKTPRVRWILLLNHDLVLPGILGEHVSKSKSLSILEQIDRLKMLTLKTPELEMSIDLTPLT